MKILFLHTNCQDYLADGIFHGLRTIYGKDVVDYPRYDAMYKSISPALRKQLRGNGFTLYGLLDEINELEAERYNWQSKISNFDIIIIANIWKQWQMLWEYRELFKNKKLVVLDGEDMPYIYPYNSYFSQFRKHPLFFFTPLSNTYYFKRELFDGYFGYSFNRIFGDKKLISLEMPKNVYPISFSIPAEKIKLGNEKTKLFQTHIVDEEVAKAVEESKFSSTGSDLTFFSNEEVFYNDMASSRFGITTKRAGWDCLRHYEIAAAGSVICFKNLHLKPVLCAPFGLDSSNSISYSCYKDLMAKIEALKDDEYGLLKKNSEQWLLENTTIQKARYLIDIVQNR